MKNIVNKAVLACLLCLVLTSPLFSMNQQIEKVEKPYDKKNWNLKNIMKRKDSFEEAKIKETSKKEKLKEEKLKEEKSKRDSFEKNELKN